MYIIWLKVVCKNIPKGKKIKIPLNWFIGYINIKITLKTEKKKIVNMVLRMLSTNKLILLLLIFANGISNSYLSENDIAAIWTIAI